ncbi:MAG: rhomboid family intramembrane serine protease [Pyrinomonadaceae bacterium]
MCRNCGAIVGAGETRCAVCGSTSGDVATAEKNLPRQVDRETLRFARAILNRPYKFTIALLISNLFVFLLMWESSGLNFSSLWQELPNEVLLAYGAKLNTLISTRHEWWRFVTPMFIHVNILHLLVNMYSLWIVGPYVEKLYGSAKFVVFWVVTGIAGVAASYLTVRPHLAVGIGRFLFKSQDVPSAGASGALFGLVGVLFVFGIKFRHELPEGFKRAFGTGMLPIIMINLFIGYLGRGFIDNAAHMGGLMSGALLALVVEYRRPGERLSVAAIWRVLQVAAVGLVAFSFFQIARRLNTSLSTHAAVQIASPATDKFVDYARVMNQGQDALLAAIYDGDTTSVAPAIEGLKTAPVLDSKATELRDGLLAMLMQSVNPVAIESPLRGPRPKASPVAKLAEDFNLWRQQYEMWLKTVAQTYNIK